MFRRKAIVPPLKGQITIAALHAITNAISFRHRMMSIHNDRDARQRRRTQFSEQAVDIRGNEVDVKVAIYLSEVCRLDIAPTKLRLWERDAAFDDFRGGGGGPIPVDLIDPSASPSLLKLEIAFRIRRCITNRHDSSPLFSGNRLADLSTNSHARVLSPKSTAAFVPGVKTWQRYAANSHVPTESAPWVRNPQVDVSAGHILHCRAVSHSCTKGDCGGRLRT